MDTGELGVEEVSVIEDHLLGCDVCQETRGEILAFDQRGTLSPPARTQSPVARPAHPPRRGGVHRQPGAPARGRVRSLAGLGASLAAVAAIILMVKYGPEEPVDDGIQIKGAPLTLEVFVERNGEVLGLDEGDPVHPGERLGFRVQSRRPGHIMIVGVDSKNAPYLCYPQGKAGQAAQTEGMDKAMTLNQAVKLDEILGNEHLILVHCDEEFAFGEIQGDLPEIPPGCTKKDIRIAKTPR
jgi:hypothetical protein